MEPVTPVVEGLQKHEIQIAKNQPEYRALPSLVIRNGIFLSRWKPTDAERAAIASGSDIFLAVWSGKQMVPVMLEVLSSVDAQEAHIKMLMRYDGI